MKPEVPQPWADAMIAAGITDPRNGERASWQELRRRTGIHASTLSAMAQGTRDTKQENIDAVAEAIGVSPTVVADWVGRARTERPPYTPPADANLLDRDERKAVDRIILLMARNKKGVTDGGQPEAQKTMTDGGADSESGEGGRRALSGQRRRGITGHGRAPREDPDAE